MNDRLQIAKEILIARSRGLYPLYDIQVDLEVKFALASANALIAAAGEGGMSEKPTSHSEPIKSDYYSLREYFEQCREAETMLKDGRIIITKTTQDDICNLVDNLHKPSVPSVEEIEEVLKNVCNTPGFPTIGSFSESLHQWLTDRNDHSKQG